MSNITMAPVRLDKVADRYGLQRRGADLEVATIGAVDASFSVPALSFAQSTAWAEAADNSVAAIIVSEAVADSYSGHAAMLVTKRDPQEVFYEIFYDSCIEARWQLIKGSIDPEARVHHGAHVAEHVSIGAGTVVMPGAVVLNNTVLGEGVTVKPNATLGGDGFQVRRIRNRPTVVPHVGGVLIQDFASIGSQTCVDRGLFGESTTVGTFTQIDNLVHIAHSVYIGDQAVVVACAEVSGSVRLGRGCWIGPNASINQSLTLGDYAFVGTAGAVVQDLPPHALAFGNPAKQRGWVCSCREKLLVEDGADLVICSSCGASFRVIDGLVQPA